MALNDFLTAQAIKALFNVLEKGPIRISGIEPERDLIIWAAPKKEK